MDIDALKGAQNIVEAIAMGLVSATHGVWAWRSRADLRVQPLGTVPLAICVTFGVASVEAGFYAADRLCHECDLAHTPIVLLLGALGTLVVVLHMIPIWRSANLDSTPRILAAVSLMTAAWLGLATLLHY